LHPAAVYHVETFKTHFKTKNTSVFRQTKENKSQRNMKEKIEEFLAIPSLLQKHCVAVLKSE
jgi:hypothetical protein